jgi:hypothetical protein
MKKIILSAVVASMALTTAASAIENVKANGMAKLIYQATDNATVAGDSLFNKTSNNGQVGLHVGMSADLSTNLSGAFEVQAVSTLGLENSLVSGVMATGRNLPGYTSRSTSTSTSTGGIITTTNTTTTTTGPEAATDDQFWISQAYLTYKMANTVAKVGLQELNTPLAFTEKWNVVNNTFQAIALVNNDIKDVTLVGAYVGKSNAAGGGQTVGYDGKFNSFLDGAYAAGAVAKVGGINAQAWFYNVQLASAAPGVGEASDITAYWLEADTKVAGIFLGAQYAGTDYDGSAGQSLNAFALKVGGDIAGVHLFAAYSQVDDVADTGTSFDSVGFANVATGDKTKLYTGTASIYADGATVANEDTTAWKIGAKTKIADIALAANYTNLEYGRNATSTNVTAGVQSGAAAVTADGYAWDISAGTKVGPVDLKAIYTEYNVDRNNATAATTRAADLSTLRLIASAKF